MNLLEHSRGVIYGLAIGDALGMPIDGLSHPNVRTYYKGIKEFRDDDKRGDLQAGQWTAHTQRALAMAEAWSGSGTTHKERSQAYQAGVEQLSLRRRNHGGTSDLAASIGPLGVVAFAEKWGADRVLEALRPLETDTMTLVAAFVQVCAIQTALEDHSRPFDGRLFLLHLAEYAGMVEEERHAAPVFSGKLVRLADHLDDFPLDLQDQSGGTGPAAEEAVPFAIAMAARAPFLPEATLLSAVNVGGASSAVGAICGALLGAFNGSEAFPEAWVSGLEAIDELRECADNILDYPDTRANSPGRARSRAS